MVDSANSPRESGTEMYLWAERSREARLALIARRLKWLMSFYGDITEESIPLLFLRTVENLTVFGLSALVGLAGVFSVMVSAFTAD
jgi:hypothetical protein